MVFSSLVGFLRRQTKDIARSLSHSRTKAQFADSACLCQHSQLVCQWSTTRTLSKSAGVCSSHVLKYCCVNIRPAQTCCAILPHTRHRLPSMSTVPGVLSVRNVLKWPCWQTLTVTLTAAKRFPQIWECFIWFRVNCLINWIYGSRVKNYSQQQNTCFTRTTLQGWSKPNKTARNRGTAWATGQGWAEN